jgi:hypothetical protein
MAAQISQDRRPISLCEVAKARSCMNRAGDDGGWVDEPGCGVLGDGCGVAAA